MNRILGHEAVRHEVLQAAVSGRLHHGWIFSGPQGIGKAGLAREIALCLLAGEEARGSVADDHPAARLFHAGTHPDYAELRRLEKDNGDLARNIGVDQVRALGRLLATAPSISSRRVIVIDSADDMERGAANALLKSLEEPPKNVVFLLVSHAPSRLLPTIRSRCHVLRLNPLDDRTMALALAQAKPDMDEDERAALIRVGEGAPGHALALSGLGITAMIDKLKRIAATGDPTNALRLDLAASLSLKAARLRYEAFLEQAPSFIARAARQCRGEALGEAIRAWEQARDLAAIAQPLTLDPASTVVELCSFVAALAPAEHRVA